MDVVRSPKANLSGASGIRARSAPVALLLAGRRTLRSATVFWQISARPLAELCVRVGEAPQVSTTYVIAPLFYFIVLSRNNNNTLILLYPLFAIFGL